MRASPFPLLSNASKSFCAQMKMATNLTPSDKRRTLGGFHLRTRELKIRDFAFGTRGNELYFP